MIKINLDSFFTGIATGFLLLMILIDILSIQALPKEIRHGYQPIKHCKSSPPKEVIGIGSKGEDA